MTWTKVRSRVYESTLAGRTVEIRGVDDLFFIYLDDKQIGYANSLKQAKADVQGVADRLAR